MELFKIPALLQILADNVRAGSEKLDVYHGDGVVKDDIKTWRFCQLIPWKTKVYKERLVSRQ